MRDWKPLMRQRVCFFYFTLCCINNTPLFLSHLILYEIQRLTAVEQLHDDLPFFPYLLNIRLHWCSSLQGIRE